MSEQIALYNLPLLGLKLVKRASISDKRGSLQRLYCHDIFIKNGIVEAIAQINYTTTSAIGAIRGMHFQYHPYAETKVISCLKGEIFDVAVDLRPESSTFLQWHGEILSPALNNSLVIPKGFAHGYQALSNDCELLYFHTEAFNQQAEGGISPFDTRLGIVWPLPITEMSERDRNHPPIMKDFKGFINEM